MTPAQADSITYDLTEIRVTLDKLLDAQLKANALAAHIARGSISHPADVHVLADAMIRDYFVRTRGWAP